MQTKLTTSDDIKKRIKVLETWFGKNGLELLFTFNNEEKFFQFDAETTCKYFKHFCIINDWWDHDGIMVEVERLTFDDDAYQLVEVEWETFASRHELSQWEAINIATLLIQNEQWRNAVNEVTAQAKSRFLNFID